MPRRPISISARIRCAEVAIRAAGYTLRYVDYCEDAHTPGFLGLAAGLIDYTRREVKVRRALHGRWLAHVLEHEFRRVQVGGTSPGHEQEAVTPMPPDFPFRQRRLNRQAGWR